MCIEKKRKRQRASGGRRQKEKSEVGVLPSRTIKTTQKHKKKKPHPEILPRIALATKRERYALLPDKVGKNSTLSATAKPLSSHKTYREN